MRLRYLFPALLIGSIALAKEQKPLLEEKIPLVENRKPLLQQKPLWELFSDKNAQIIFQKILQGKTNNEQKRWINAIEFLQIDEAQLRELDGFECFQNLKRLSLARNLIKNALPLTSLPRLEELDLSNNGINNAIATILSGIETLKILNVSSNQLKYTYTCNFKDMEELNLSHNKIEQIQATNANDLLTSIDISDNPTTSILPPFALPSLKIFLANKTFLRDLSPLFACKNLEVLEVENCCHLKSIEKWFTLQGLSYVCVFPKLKKLSISENFLNEKSKEILKSLYQGMLDHRIILNGRTIESKHPLQEKTVIRLNP